MTFKHITSRDNAIFKQLKKLSENARERDKAQRTLLDGVHLIEAYAEIYGEPELLIIPEGKSTAEATVLMQTMQDVNTVMFPTLMFAELSPVATSTGILSLVKIPQLSLPEQIHFAMALEEIQDPGNLGSMLRTAAAAGVQAVYLSKGCTDVWSPKALRGGQGAQFVLPLIENVALKEVIEGFKGNTFAMCMQGKSLYTQDLKSPVMFVIGNEGSGLSTQIRQSCNHELAIPMASALAPKLAIESLNAAAAAAICLFECQRQRLQ